MMKQLFRIYLDKYYTAHYGKIYLDNIIYYNYFNATFTTNLDLKLIKIAKDEKLKIIEKMKQCIIKELDIKWEEIFPYCLINYRLCEITLNLKQSVSIILYYVNNEIKYKTIKSESAFFEDGGWNRSFETNRFGEVIISNNFKEILAIAMY